MISKHRVLHGVDGGKHGCEGAHVGVKQARGLRRGTLGAV